MNKAKAQVARFVVTALMTWFGVVGAWAQTTTTYVNGTDGTINGTTTCTAPLVRNFTVSTSFTVGDVDLGFYATHTWRGDIRVTLQSPGGTRVQIVSGDSNNISGDNLNVRLSDEQSQTVNTDSATGNHSTTAPPPFANQFAPNNPLSAFDGQNSLGTWRLEVCDIFPSQDNGTFRHAELYLTSAPTNYADLSLTKTVSNNSPAFGANVTYTLTARNASSSPQTATGVVVRDQLPPGAVYVSDNGGGAYNSATGNWTVGTLTAGQSRTLQIVASVNASAGATISNVAEITASSQVDFDSTPNNGVTTEDDYAFANFTVAGTPGPGVAPTLICTAGSIIQDWGALTWAVGSTNNTYTIAGIGPIEFALSNTAVPDATLAGFASISQAQTGGFAAEDNLYLGFDFTNRTDFATVEIDLPTAVLGAQFRIYDVDLGSWADEITVTGTYNGATVFPVLTNGSANYVAGNRAFGSAGSNATSGNGNITVTFQSAIDSITILYGNHSGAANDPGGQVIALADITWCNPEADVSVTKISSVYSDPVNGTNNPKAIPGATMEYLITATNSGDSGADNIVIVDAGPANAKLCFALTGWTTPLTFTDGSPSSGLTYNYIDLTNAADDIEFSDDGGLTWNHEPTDDGEGCDGAITHFRITPSGQFLGNSAFTLRARYIIE